MTTIAVVKTDDLIIMGSDSLGSNGFTGQSYINKKIFRKDNFLIGVCGSYRLINILNNKLTIPIRKVNQNIDDFIYNDFSDSIIKLIKDNNILKIDNNIYNLENSNFVFAYEDKIFEFQSDCSITEPKRNFSAIGSGKYHAEASLYSTEGLEITGEERIKRAIICANNFVLSVNNEIEIETLKYK